MVVDKIANSIEVWFLFIIKEKLIVVASDCIADSIHLDCLTTVDGATYAQLYMQ